jgi:hypothetical protein
MLIILALEVVSIGALIRFRLLGVLSARRIETLIMDLADIRLNAQQKPILNLDVASIRLREIYGALPF